MTSRRMDSLPSHKLVCDFCAKPDPEWDYPCAPFVMYTLETERGVEHTRSVGGWMACGVCSDVIETNAPTSPADAVVRLIEVRRRMLGPMILMTEVSLCETWLSFFQHRQGERVPVTAEFQREALPNAVGSRILAQAQIDRAVKFQRRKK